MVFWAFSSHLIRAYSTLCILALPTISSTSILLSITFTDINFIRFMYIYSLISLKIKIIFYADSMELFSDFSFTLSYLTSSACFCWEMLRSFLIFMKWSAFAFWLFETRSLLVSFPDFCSCYYISSTFVFKLESISFWISNFDFNSLF